jgi:hypothetical protein
MRGQAHVCVWGGGGGVHRHEQQRSLSLLAVHCTSVTQACRVCVWLMVVVVVGGGGGVCGVPLEVPLYQGA